MLVTTSTDIPIVSARKPKMNTILLVFAIASSAFVVFGASTGTAAPRRRLEDFVKDKCFNNSHNNHAFEALFQAGLNYQQCEKEAFHNDPPHPVEEHDEFCRYFKENGYYSCMKNLAFKVLPCLDKTEIFFPHMILKAYNTTFNKLCGTDGFLNTEYIFNKIDRNRDCLYNAMLTIAMGGRCIENLPIYENVQQNIIDLNKHDYCIDMKSFASCATEVIEESCTEDFTLLISEVSDLFLNVCNK